MDTFTIVILFTISSAMVAVFTLPGIRIGLNVADEAYLHFGTVSLLQGQTPILDFRAYDPGRYYWCALWMKFLGLTFVAQRLAMGLIMIVTLTMIGAWVFYVSQSWVISSLAALISLIWLQPYFKAIEILFSIITLTVAWFIITDPGTAIYLCSGFLVGIALFFGLNIGLYTGLSLLLALGLSFILAQTGMSGVPLAWMPAGFLLGLVPILLLGFRHPGYFSAYWHKKVLPVFARGSSNLPLSLPWLWSSPAQVRHLLPAQRLFFKAVFTGLLPFYVVSFAVGFSFTGTNSSVAGLLMSASLVGLVYLHHLFSRADLEHLCTSIHPALLIASVLAAVFLPWYGVALVLVIIAVLSALAILPQFSMHLNFLYNRYNFTDYDNGREVLTLGCEQAENFKVLKQFIDSHSSAGDKVFFAPTLPGFYQLFNRRPALYDVYCIYPETDENQSRMIQSLSEQETRIVVINEQAIDGNDALRFSETHAQVWRYLHEHFDRVENEQLPGTIKLFKVMGE